VHRIDLDTAVPAVQQFICSLPVDPEGVELTLQGEVLCKVIGPQQLTDDEKEAVLQEGWELIRQARLRNQGVPAKVIEQEVHEAVQQVRRQNQP